MPSDQNPILSDHEVYRKFSVPRSYNEKTRSVTAILATEAPCRVPDYLSGGGEVDEILLMSGAVLPDSGQVPFLDNHNLSSFRCILGSCRGLRLEGDQLVSDIFFTDDDIGQAVEKQIRDGHLTDLSIGATILDFEKIPAGQTRNIGGKSFDGPARIITKWEPFEASAVPVGADKNSIIRQRGGNMPKAITTNNQNINDPGQTRGFDATQTLIQERRRAAEITELCKIGHYSKFAEQFIMDGTSVDEVRRQVMTHMIKTNPPIGAGAINMGATAEEKSGAAIVDGLLIRSGFTPEKPAPGAEDFRHASLVDIARLVHGNNTNENVRVMSPSQVVKKAMTTRAAGGSTSSDFPSILANVGNKILRESYKDYPTTFETWTVKGRGRDFKDMHRVSLSQAPGLLEIREHGEYIFGAFGDSKEVFKIKKHGRMFRISWEAIINDDLDAFGRIARAFISSAKRGLNAAVYDELIGNRVMSDGKGIFHADHNNLAAGLVVGAIDIDKLTAARLAMRTQTGFTGLETDDPDPLNLEPRYLIIPAALETVADTIVNTIEGYDSASGPGVRNPFYKKLQPVVESYLDKASSTAWYLSADPRICDTVEVCYLDGNEVPYIEEREGWEIDSWEFKIRFCYGVKALDHRGLYKNPGA